MTIYILDQDPEETAKSLDNKSLKFMIKDIAQALCNVHWIEHAMKYSPLDTERFEWCENNIPLKEKNLTKCKWSQWARECVANYEYLVELVKACLYEWDKRFGRDGLYWSHNKGDVIRWANDNVPDLPTETPCPFNIGIILSKTQLPLVMPKKYIIYGFDPEDFYREGDGQSLTIQSYRNYYQAKLGQRYGVPRGEALTATQITNRFKLDLKWTLREKPEWLNI